MFRSNNGPNTLIRAHDWNSSALGAPEHWPQPPRTAIRLLLNTGHPMYVWWGPDLLCFYNDPRPDNVPDFRPYLTRGPAKRTGMLFGTYRAPIRIAHFASVA